MRETGRGQRLAVSAAALALICVACSDDHIDDDAERQWSTEDAIYVLPAELPAGWTLGRATQRIEQTESADGGIVRFGDYTVSWVLEENAGQDRSHVRDDGPGFWINSGSRYYEDVYWPAILGGSLPPEPTIGPYSDATPITREGDISGLSFRVECCIVSLGSTGVSDEILRSVAASLVAFDVEEWQSALGDRLLIDDQT